MHPNFSIFFLFTAKKKIIDIINHSYYHQHERLKTLRFEKLIFPLGTGEIVHWIWDWGIHSNGDDDCKNCGRLNDGVGQCIKFICGGGHGGRIGGQGGRIGGHGGKFGGQGGKLGGHGGKFGKHGGHGGKIGCEKNGVHGGKNWKDGKQGGHGGKHDWLLLGGKHLFITCCLGQFLFFDLPEPIFFCFIIYYSN